MVIFLVNTLRTGNTRMNISNIQMTILIPHVGPNNEQHESHSYG